MALSSTKEWGYGRIPFRVPLLWDNLPALAQSTHLQSLRAAALKNAI
jgi:hypothetical protein